jgi:hypothetical protein
MFIHSMDVLSKKLFFLSFSLRLAQVKYLT